MTVVVALGVKNSVGFNNALNVINLIVWVFMMIAGLFFVNGENWNEGRFLPFGWSGVCTHINKLKKRVKIKKTEEGWRAAGLSYLLVLRYVVSLDCSR